MRTRINLAIIGAVLATSALSGCTEKGTPVARDTGTPTTSATSPSKDDDPKSAPKVTKPLDAAGFIGKPCTLLASTQSTGLGLEAEGAQDQGVGDPFCSWSDKERRADYTVGFISPNRNGLSDTYRAMQKPGEAAYFEPTTVAGYPGVFVDGLDDRDRGHCKVIVGVRDELAFHVFSQGGPGRAACDKVKDIAGEVITTLKAGA
ncbi:hypothetical protein [Alloactinosynnema sp. L-07]|uniref:DUF3558 domain-containing protein n=1 Tax=Alloactinosynnema sp. L-07 TaxID=1653480 RepID=UPI00065EFB32|nr:DUF3558 domain-containing protein [Alloactinosynnema sp. L-07]CRK61190.1 hypothetical protein [Alloactinosynnema sp. L-07]